MDVHDDLENREPIVNPAASRAAMGKNPTRGQKQAFGAALNAESNIRKIRSDYANSPAGIGMQTVEGLPAAAKTVGKAVLGSLKKGGPIKKTGTYRLHEGEQVLPKKKAEAYRSKRRMTSSGFMPRRDIKK